MKKPAKPPLSVETLCKLDRTGGGRCSDFAPGIEAFNSLPDGERKESAFVTSEAFYRSRTTPCP